MNQTRRITRWITCCAVVIVLAVGGFACQTSSEKPLNAHVKPTSATSPPQAPSSVVPLPAGERLALPTLSDTTTNPPPVNYTQVKKDINATLKAQPKSLDLRMQAAQIYMKAGDYASAIPHLQVATTLSPKSVVPWIALGDAATLELHFDLASRAYDRAAALDSHNAQIVRGRGQMLLLQRKWKEARQTLERGVARYPKDAEIRTVLGNLYLILNKPRLAAEAIKPALQLQPDRADLHYMLGEAYERDLHIEAAIQEMRETTRLEPNDPEAWGKIGLYENNLTRYKEAREPLERAIALAPKEAHYYWALGDSYLLESTDSANFDRAAELYRKALSLNGTNEKALYSFGMALTRRGRPADLKEAVELFTKLIRLKPRDMNAHYKLADTFRRLGQEKEAAAEQATFQTLFAKSRQQDRQLNASTSFKDTADAHLKLGLQAMTAKDYALAATEFQLALERDPKITKARDGLQQAQRHIAAVSTGTAQ